MKVAQQGCEEVTGFFVHWHVRGVLEPLHRMVRRVYILHPPRYWFHWGHLVVTVKKLHDGNCEVRNICEVDIQELRKDLLNAQRVPACCRGEILIAIVQRG